MWNYKFSSKMKKKIHLGTKMLIMGLWTGMLKNNCHVCNQRPPIRLIAKFCTKSGILKFGTKNALFRCFRQQFWKTIVILEINGLEFAIMQSLAQKIKILKFGTKNARFAYFWTGIWKYYCHIWNQHPRLCQSLVQKTRILKFRTKNVWFG